MFQLHSRFFSFITRIARFSLLGKKLRGVIVVMTIYFSECINALPCGVITLFSCL